MPGPTKTNFFNRAEMLDTKVGASDSKDDPAVVAKAAFEALQTGNDKVLPTLKNRVMGTVADLLPDKAAAQIHRKMAEPGSAG
jgi:short-subunit dehydrogenase